MNDRHPIAGCPVNQGIGLTSARMRIDIPLHMLGDEIIGGLYMTVWPHDDKQGVVYSRNAVATLDIPIDQYLFVAASLRRLIAEADKTYRRERSAEERAADLKNFAARTSPS